MYFILSQIFAYVYVQKINFLNLKFDQAPDNEKGLLKSMGLKCYVKIH